RHDQRATRPPRSLDSTLGMTRRRPGRLRCAFAFDRSFVIALRVVAVLDVPLAFGRLLEEVRRGALRAGLVQRAVVQRELAFRVARAGVEDAAARAALDELTFAAVRALHAGRLGRRRLAAADLADVLAVGISRARIE